MSTPPRPPELDAVTRRALAAGLFNRCWELLGLPARTPAQDDALLHAAHASRHHWDEVGAPAHLARGEWMCARVYSTLGRAEPALHHAARCLALVEEGTGDPSFEDWDLAAACEGLARASLVAGDRGAAAGWHARAADALASVADPEDREVIEKDLASLAI